MVRDVAAILLFNDEGKILLQKRSDDSERASGKWGFFGGGIEKGETEYDAVLRECFEEINYKLKNPQLIKKKLAPNKIDTMYVFYEKYDNQQKIILGEGQGYGWFDIDEVKELYMSPNDKEILLEIKNTY